MFFATFKIIINLTASIGRPRKAFVFSNNQHSDIIQPVIKINVLALKGWYNMFCMLNIFVEYTVRDNFLNKRHFGSVEWKIMICNTQQTNSNVKHFAIFGNDISMRSWVVFGGGGETNGQTDERRSLSGHMFIRTSLFCCPESLPKVWQPTYWTTCLRIRLQKWKVIFLILKYI